MTSSRLSLSPVTSPINEYITDSYISLKFPQNTQNLTPTELNFTPCERIQCGQSQSQRDLNQSLKRGTRKRMPGRFHLYELAPSILLHPFWRPASWEKIYSPCQVFNTVTQNIHGLQTSPKLDGSRTMELFSSCPC